MPFADLGELRTYYERHGDPALPPLLLSHSLGVTSAMWDTQVPALLPHFHVIRYDTRGHGQSTATPGPYTITQLGSDALALLDHLHLDRVNFCGLSMGGMIGMGLAIHAPHRLHKLALTNTAARIGTPEVWNTRIQTVEQGGITAIVEGVLQRWFSPTALAQPTLIAAVREMLLHCPPIGYTACCAAIRDMDQRTEVARITTPTLILSGTHDLVTPPAEGLYLHHEIAGSAYAELPAAHLSNIEAAQQYTQQLLHFLTH